VRILGGDSRANLVVARVKEALTLCRHWLALYRKTATSGTASEYSISFEVRPLAHQPAGARTEEFAKWQRVWTTSF